MTHVLYEFGRTIVLRGFGLPSRDSSDDSRVIVILEEMSRQQARGEFQSQAKDPAPKRKGAVALKSLPVEVLSKGDAR